MGKRHINKPTDYMMAPVRMPRFLYWLLLTLMASGLNDSLGITQLEERIAITCGVVAILFLVIGFYNYYWLEKGFRV